MSHFRSNMEAERAIEARRWHKPQAVLRPSSRFRKLWKSTTRKAFRNRSLSEVRQYQGTRSLSGPWNGVNGSSMEVQHLRTLMNRCSLKAGAEEDLGDVQSPNECLDPDADVAEDLEMNDSEPYQTSDSRTWETSSSCSSSGRSV